MSRFISWILPIYKEFFTSDQVKRLVNIKRVSNEVSDTTKDKIKQLLNAVKNTTSDETKELIIDDIVDIFVFEGEINIFESFIGEDVSFDLSLNEGDDWSGYKIVVRTQTDLQALHDTSLFNGDSYANESTQTITVDDIGSDLNLTDESLLKLIISLEDPTDSNDWENSESDGDVHQVVGEFWLILKDNVDSD